MLESMKLRGDDNVKKLVAQLEDDSSQFRAEREAAAPSTAYMGVSRIAPGLTPTPDRDIYDAKRQRTLPGTLVRSEGDPAGHDDFVNQAYDGAGDTYDLYLHEFQRDSLDGQGMKLVSTVHYGRDYDNAFWNGSQMAYGDGGLIFKPLTGSLSVIGHELSHGVVQFSGGLIYEDQSGALNESFADVFGALTVQRKKGHLSAQAEWLIGEDLLLPAINGVALRSMKAPGTAYDDQTLGKDPQPFHMDGFVNTTRDRGGVRINSGIPNHAFYLLAQYLGGNAWEKAGHIWYDTLQAISDPNATFNAWADKTVEIARNLYGAGSLEATFTRRAWKLVGITV